MNIRKIIREELAGWEWAEGETTFKETLIMFEPPLDYEVESDKIDKVFKNLRDEGVTWQSGNDLYYTYSKVINQSYGQATYIALSALSIDELGNLSFWSVPSEYTKEVVFRTELITHTILDGRDIFSL